MPENASEFLWWGFNGAILIILYLLRTDLGEIKKDIKDTKQLQEDNKVAIAEIRSTCAERHIRLDQEIVGIKAAVHLRREGDKLTA